MLLMIPALVLFSCSELPSADEAGTGEHSRQILKPGGVTLAEGALLPVPESVQNREEAVRSREKASASVQRRYKRVLVHPKGEVPGSHGAPVVDNLSDAVDRVEAGGTIIVWEGEYVVSDSIVIDRALTMQPKKGDRPLIRNTGRNAFLVTGVPEGVVHFSGLRFENSGGHSSIWVEFSEVMISGSAFDTREGVTGAFAFTGGILTVEESTFRGGSVGVFASSAGSKLTVRNSDFRGHSFAAVQWQVEATGTLTGSTMSDCGQWGCARSIRSGTTEFLNNRFSEDVTDQEVDGITHHVVVYSASTGRVSDNIFDGCGHGQCVAALRGSSLEVTGNRFDIYEDHNTRFAVVGSDGFLGDGPPGSEVEMTVNDNMIIGTGGTFNADPGNEDAYAVKFSAIQIEHGSRMKASRNTIDNAKIGISALDGGIISVGMDNRVENVHRAIAIFNGDPAALILHRNDFFGYHIALEGGSGSSSLTCNWWGTSAGPQNVQGGPESLWTPWATEPIAGTATDPATCTGGI